LSDSQGILSVEIAIVAGEPSGDVLAAGLIRELKLRVPEARFYGIGGEHMQAEGFEQLYPMDSIAVMGIESVLKDLRHILNIRSSLRKKVLNDKPDCFIGVDVPDFNLSLEKRLREEGIKVVHYVSPSVWAWRGYRIKKIQKAVDHMLTLFPFEKQYYDGHDIPATFIGHPSADRSLAIRPKIDISDRQNTIALLPGSRRAEVQALLPIMLEAAKLIVQRYPDTKFVLPFANEQLKNQHQASALDYTLPVRITLGQSEQALGSARLSIVASGTAALEAMMFGSVMVVIYKMAWLSYAMFNYFKHVEHFSLPNHLLDTPQIPELEQHEVTAENIFEAVTDFLENPGHMLDLEEQFESVAQMLHKDTDALAAKTVLKVISSPFGIDAC
jgi:lipid-A-disaccharide synthase